MRYYLITLFLVIALSASASDEVVVVQSSGQVSWSISSLKDITFAAFPFGIPEMIAALCVVLLQAWKRNSLISILLGTAVYMALVQLVF